MPCLYRSIRAFAIVICVALVSCSQVPAGAKTALVGPWMLKLDLLNGSYLPVDLEFSLGTGSNYSVVFMNGEERIEVRDVELHGDSILVTMPLYDSKFFGRIGPSGQISGNWVNYVKGKDYVLPFTALPGPAPRFEPDGDGVFSNASGKWEVDFLYKDGREKATALFTQKGDQLEGTFLTETGDYRFLEGGIVDDKFHLSCFDGSHAFLFAGRVVGDSIVDGRFMSGKHWSCEWVAKRNDYFELTNADSLTSLKEGYQMVDFSLPNMAGDSISPNDPQFKGKVTLVQIMGSWCPNCVDETALLCELYQERHDEGLEVLALAFEVEHGTPRSIERVQRLIDHFNIPYDVLLAGPANKAAASSTLPFLDNIISYPTCIFIDRNGKVRKIRAGFNGPGTGKHYTEYVQQLNIFIDGLLTEKVLASDQ